MNLSQYVKIFMLIHRSFSCFIEQNVVFISDLLNFSLKDSIMVNQRIISIFSLSYCHLEFFFDLFLNKSRLTFDVICYLAKFYWFSFY